MTQPHLVNNFLNTNTVTVIYGATNNVLKTINVGDIPNEIIYNPSNKAMYVVNFGSDDVSVINSATNTVIKTINVGDGPEHLEYNPNGYIYVVEAGT